MKIILLASFLISFQAHALSSRPSGYEQGNGGSMVVCPSESIQGEGVFSLDYIEGLYLHQLSPAPSIQKMQSESEIVEYILTNLALVNPTRAALYQQWLKEILSSREFVDGFSFLPLPDNGPTFIPEDCKHKQAAIFVTSREKTIVRFLFDKTLWEKASALDRAYLLMHELIYREATLPENSHRNSGATRYFTAWLMSNIDQISPEEMVLLVQELGFKRTDYNGVSLNLNSRIYLGNITHLLPAPMSHFKDSKKIKKAPLADSFSIRIGDEVFQRVCNDSFTTNGFSSFVEFYPSGQVKRMHFEMYDGYVPISNTPGYAVTNCNFHGANYLEFDEFGNLTKAEARETLTNETYEDEN